MTPDERALVVEVVGAADEPLLRALRDARGPTFERLEFLGDSVLDLVMATHAVVTPHCAECPRPADGHRAAGSGVQRFVTDERLARRAEEVGLGAWLEWDAGPDRHADLVEACVAVAWLAGRWRRAAGLVQRVVHPVGGVTADVLVAGTPSGDGGAGAEASARSRRRLGAAVLELTAAQVVFVADPEADEGVLSGRRAALHRTALVARHAREQRLVVGDGPDPVVSDRVEERLADELLRHGADAALAAARGVLVVPRGRA